jgi:uncharacterized Ntn-hydrolase superfamily protein
MTFSICARDARTGQVGVGAITAMVGVGKLVCHAQSGVGAIATQAMINPYLAFDGLTLLDKGLSAGDALAAVLERDDGRDFRQVGVVGRDGSTAGWTGSETPDWSGHVEGVGVIAQGNRLVGPETLDAVLDAYHSHADLELAHRLLRALEAGEATGADTEGALSGAIYVMDSEEYPLWDARVDHSGDPAADLRELIAEFDEQLVPQVRRLSTRDDYVGEMTREQMAQSES